MLNPFKRKKNPCSYYKFCGEDCGKKLEKETCEVCPAYIFLDSGYGLCNFGPEPVLVPWCKRTCVFYSILKAQVPATKEVLKCYVKPSCPFNKNNTCTQPGGKEYYDHCQEILVTKNLS